MEKGKRKKWPLWLGVIIFLLILFVVIWNCYHREIHSIKVEKGGYKDIYYTCISDGLEDSEQRAYVENVLLNKMVRLDSGSIDISDFSDYNFKVIFYDKERDVIILTRIIKEYTDNPLYYYLFKDGELVVDLISVVGPEEDAAGNVVIYSEYSNYYDYVLHQNSEYIIKGVLGILARVVIGVIFVIIFAYAILELKISKVYRLLAFLSIIKLGILNTFFFNNNFDLKTLIFYIPVYEIIINIIEYKIVKKKVLEYGAEEFDRSKWTLYYVLSNILLLIVTYFSLYFVPMI